MTRLQASGHDAHQQAAAELQAFVLREIPLLRAMQAHIHAWDHEHIELRAPLAPNVNDKGCAFGGSLASLMTVAPWALLELALREAGIKANLFVARASIRCIAPIFEDLRVLAAPADGADIAGFCQAVRKTGKARIAMRARALAGTTDACVQECLYVAKLPGPPAA